jgi:lipopolysaccharide/colanic/teichoic acid biosynthesis glycosyltransferase
MKKSIYVLYGKPIVDFSLSLFLLIFTSPILLLLIFFQILFNGFPVFFCQLRVGKDEKVFKLIKFRTMNNNLDKDGNLLPDVKRRTWFGTFLRKTSIDELPSLINILIGDMSLVGPRPLLGEYLPLYNNFQKMRHSVKPGLSGLAQVKGRNAISWNQKFAYDIEYLKKISFMNDLKIILKSIYVVLFQSRTIDQSKTETYEKFKGNKIN